MTLAYYHVYWPETDYEEFITAGDDYAEKRIAQIRQGCAQAIITELYKK